MLLAAVGAAAECPAEQPVALGPADPARCAALAPDVRRPGALPLEAYEAKLGEYLRGFCHRDEAAGWVRDKRLRDTGPFVAGFGGDGTKGKALGTHGAVLVWYAPEMVAWLRAERPDGAAERAGAAPVPDGAMIVKEMVPGPAAACAAVDPLHLKPLGGAAVMVRDAAAARDGWFWGWFGWEGWHPDRPSPASNAYPNMGFGQYCVNCHASASDNLTFSSLRNIRGEPGEPLVYLSQGVIPSTGEPPHHEAATRTPLPVLPTPDPGVARAFMGALGLLGPPPTETVVPMPSESLDTVWARPEGHGGRGLDGFVTSDQCLGCHDAGSTGLQFDMTARRLDGLLVNLSPYATWRSSPMGMAGRDPIFLAQLASESQTFHPKAAGTVQDACLGCHGVLGQRAYKVAGVKAADAAGGPVGTSCRSLSRKMLDAFPKGDPFPALADYAGLARDGVSCLACHRMALGAGAQAARAAPENACLPERRALLTPGLTGTAARFTGSFELGPADTVNGPFERPLQVPMKTALGMAPQHTTAIGSAELCGSCHTVHLPILHEGRVIGHTYEQTTYAEWAFSAYRTGATPDGPLPAGPGEQAQSCQGCHMPSREADGHPTRSKIASIQEYSTFPQSENTREPGEIDLPTREGFARHTLVGLNLVFVKMAQQFPDLLGLRLQDPMLAAKGVDPLVTTEQAILDQAKGRTAQIAVTDIVRGQEALEATVAVTNRTGHKFPSGVGFRRAFITFTVRDAGGQVLWASGRTDAAGVILDGAGQPLPSELWWAPNCAGRIAPEERRHQPHREVIARQDEVQIYEDLAAAPAQGATPRCEPDAPLGPLTTSFLSRCTRVKDNRLLPAGFLDRTARIDIARALGAKDDLAREAGTRAVGDDPDYREGGGDSLRYRIPLRDLAGVPASVEAVLSYQSTPPYYLQDRFCTAQGQDAQRLAVMSANLDLSGTPAEGWALRIAETGPVPVR